MTGTQRKRRKRLRRLTQKKQRAEAAFVLRVAARLAGTLQIDSQGIQHLFMPHARGGNPCWWSVSAIDVNSCLRRGYISNAVLVFPRRA